MELSFKTLYSRIFPNESCTACLTLKAPESTPSTDMADVEETKQACEIVAVMDTSGSMHGRPIELVNKGMKHFLMSTPAGEKTSLITFSDRANVVWPMKDLTATEREIYAPKVHNLHANGNTNIGSALIQALDQFTDAPGVKSIVFLTDGRPTVGITSSFELLEKLKTHPRWGAVEIHAIALGSSVDLDFLKNITDKTLGSFYPVQDSDALLLAFGDCIGGIHSVVAQDVNVVIPEWKRTFVDVFETGFNDVDPVPGFNTATGRFGGTSGTNDNGGRYRWKLGNLFGGEVRNILFTVPPIMASKTLCVKITSVDATTGHSSTTETNVTFPEWVTNHDDEEKIKANSNFDVSVQLLRAKCQKALQAAERVANRKQFLQGLKEEIVQFGHADHLAVKIMLDDVNMLLENADNQVQYGACLIGAQAQSRQQRVVASSQAAAANIPMASLRKQTSEAYYSKGNNNSSN